MRFLLREEKIPVYRGVIKGLQPNVEGDGRAEWWTVSKDKATSYWQDGTDDEGALLTSVIDLDKVNLIDLGKQTDVTSVYLGKDLNDILGTRIIARERTKEGNFVYIKYKDSFYRMSTGLDDLQVFYHKIAREQGYDGILVQFSIGGKTVTEIALLKSGLIEYDAPSWYDKKWDKKE